jgi:hypothetical protein
VAALLVVKVLAHELSWEYIKLTSLYSSIVAGGIFVIGLIVVGTLTDYKESERVPAEMGAALENIYRDCEALKQTNPEFDLETLRLRLLRIVSAFKSDLASANGRSCLAAIEELTPSFLELERLGEVPGHVIRLRGEQGALRRAVLRVYHIQRTEFLPSGYALIETSVVLIIVAAVFTDVGPLQDALPLFGFISYFFLYMVRLLKLLDRPFRPAERTTDDVSLFLLDEFAERAASGAARDARERVPAGA